MTEQPSTHSVIVVTLAELIGVSILAIIADSSDTLGKVAVALMAGWLLIFLMSNADWLQSLTSKL
jgi:hypothetical protein